MVALHSFCLVPNCKLELINTNGIVKVQVIRLWLFSLDDMPEAFLNLGPFTLAKTKIQKTWVFCCTVYTARKTHNIRGFWHEKRMREKTRISYLCFGKWCACVTSLYL